MNLKELLPYLLVGIVLTSVAVSVGYIGYSASGNQNNRNELQKHVAILTTVNLLTAIFLGILFYYYIQMNSASFVPFTIMMMTFNLFLSIMAVSVAVLTQTS
jgi:hypothetical protein